MMFDDAALQLRTGESPRAVAERLVGEGLSPQTAYEVVGVLTGNPPDVVPASVFPLDTAVRPTGQELFDAKTHEEQDEMLGPDVAQVVRDGTVRLSDLVVTNRMETEPDFITQATPVDLGLDSSKEEGK